MWVQIKSIVSFFWNHLDRLINIIVLAVSIIALWIAIKSMKNQNIQFEQNSKSSDSLFQVQLSNSRELNDSLVSQIKSLQSITNKQLGITDEQLKISKQTFNEKMYSERPILFIATPTMLDTNVVFGNEFSPIIVVKITNIGSRAAKNIEFRIFVVLDDSSIRGASPDFSNIDHIEKDVTSIQYHKPKIPLKNKYEFYYCVDIEYYDELLGKYFYSSRYYFYQKSRNKMNFDGCTENEKSNVRKILNKELKSNKLRLFE
jgi:hypothetical protein